MLAAIVTHSAVDRLVRRPALSSVTANAAGPAIATASTAQNIPSRRPGRRTATIDIGSSAPSADRFSRRDWFILAL